MKGVQEPLAIGHCSGGLLVVICAMRLRISGKINPSGGSL
jgi:hypothetical protein